MSKYTDSERAEALYNAMREAQGDNGFLPDSVGTVVANAGLKRMFLGRQGYSSYKVRQTAKWLASTDLVDYYGRNYKVVDVDKDFPDELRNNEDVDVSDERSFQSIFTNTVLTNRSGSEPRDEPSEVSPPVGRTGEEPSPVVQSDEVAKALAEAMWRRYDRVLTALGEAHATIDSLKREVERLRRLVDEEPLDMDHIVSRIVQS